MPRIFLLISYPKSGNTWLRALLESLRSGGAPIDINDMGSGVVPRLRFDALLSVESSSLTPAEIAEARPAFMRLWAERIGIRRFSRKRTKPTCRFPVPARLLIRRRPSRRRYTSFATRAT